MKDKPYLQLSGQDSNVFAILGSASQLLKRDHRREDTDEMLQRVQKCKSYDEALILISEYVQTELSGEDHGVLEEDDFNVDKEFIFSKDGVTAYINAGFDVEKKFDIALHNKEYIDFYATWHPETDHFNATAVIVHQNDIRTYKEINLFPTERRLILSEMERVAHKHYNKSLRELFADWKKDYEDRQTKIPEKEKQKQRYE